MRKLARRVSRNIGSEHIDTVMFWITLAVVGGGRAGDLLLYRISDFARDPSMAFNINQGGMSFFGGFVAVAVVLVIYSRSSGVPLLGLTDITAAATPAGLFLGRLGNVVNRELYGPETSLPWGVTIVSGSAPRHPTALYEALLEGLVLFTLLYPAALWGRGLCVAGRTTGLFLCGYALFRIPIEALRTDYDPFRLIGLPVSLAQLLCIPMCVLGCALLLRVARQPAGPGVSFGGDIE